MAEVFHQHGRWQEALVPQHLFLTAAYDMAAGFPQIRESETKAGTTISYNLSLEVACRHFHCILLIGSHSVRLSHTQRRRVRWSQITCRRFVFFYLNFFLKCEYS